MCGEHNEYPVKLLSSSCHRNIDIPPERAAIARKTLGLLIPLVSLISLTLYDRQSYSETDATLSHKCKRSQAKKLPGLVSLPRETQNLLLDPNKWVML